MTDTEPLETEPLVQSEPEADSAPDEPRPRIRWGAIAWGLIVVLVALETLMISGSPSARTGFTEWLFSLSPTNIVVVVFLVIGGFILLQGVLALLRRAQRARQ